MALSQQHPDQMCRAYAQPKCKMETCQPPQTYLWCALPVALSKPTWCWPAAVWLLALLMPPSQCLLLALRLASPGCWPCDADPSSVCCRKQVRTHGGSNKGHCRTTHCRVQGCAQSTFMRPAGAQMPCSCCMASRLPKVHPGSLNSMS